MIYENYEPISNQCTAGLISGRKLAVQCKCRSAPTELLCNYHVHNRQHVGLVVSVFVVLQELLVADDERLEVPMNTLHPSSAQLVRFLFHVLVPQLFPPSVLPIVRGAALFPRRILATPVDHVKQLPSPVGDVLRQRFDEVSSAVYLYGARLEGWVGTAGVHSENRRGKSQPEVGRVRFHSRLSRN